MNLEELLTLLENANEAYRNSDTPLLSDDEYDEYVEQLRQLAPNHPFLIKSVPPSKEPSLFPFT